MATKKTASPKAASSEASTPPAEGTPPAATNETAPKREPRRPRKMRVARSQFLIWPDRTPRGGPGEVVVWENDPTIEGFEHALEFVPDEEYDDHRVTPITNNAFLGQIREAGINVEEIDTPPKPPTPEEARLAEAGGGESFPKADR